MTWSAGVIVWSDETYRLQTLLRAASGGYSSGMALREIARARKRGCIIRARLFNVLMVAPQPAPGFTGVDP